MENKGKGKNDVFDAVSVIGIVVGVISIIVTTISIVQTARKNKRQKNDRSSAK